MEITTQHTHMEAKIKRLDLATETTQLVTIDDAIKTIKNYYDLKDEVIKDLLLKRSKFYTPYASYTINK